MISRKTDKELAFLHDLFIAPDWGERFAEMIDEHVKLPKEGKIAYVASGTGGHAIALQERAGVELELICIDENAECLEIAQAKAIATNQNTEFRKASIDDLPLADNEFDLVVGNASLIQRRRLRKMFSEMVRITTPGGTLALTLPTASSFGEFFSIFWEALHNRGLLLVENDLEHLITELPTITDVEQMAEAEGLEDVKSWTRIEEFDYESGEKFLSAPLVAEFLMEEWLATVPENSRGEVAQEISRLINEERHEAEFALSVKATLLVGRKTHTH